MSPARDHPADRRPPRRLAAALDDVASGLGMAPTAEARWVVEHWSDLVGSHLAARTRVARLDGDVLAVLADDPAWAAEIRSCAGEIVAAVGRACGPGVVASVRVAVRPPDRPR